MESSQGQEEASVEAEASETNLTEPVEDETWNSDEELADDTVIVEFGSNKNCRIPMQKSAIVQIEKAEA